MKKVLWIACLLCMMPFLGYTQKHAGLAQQDKESVFRQAPVSKELPSTIQLKNITRTRDGGNANANAPEVWAHAMYIPGAGQNFGRYYEVSENGEITSIRMYNDWYFGAAEYFYDADASSTVPEYPVWAYSDDYLQRMMNLHYDNGSFNQTIDYSDLQVVNPMEDPFLAMQDITYDYANMRMLGIADGRIYLIDYEDEQLPGRYSDTLYNYEDNNGLQPIAIACDLDGTVYFVSASTDGQTPSDLYKFASDDEDLEMPIFVKTLDWPAMYYQTMAFNHKTRELFWWACTAEGAGCKSQLKQIVNYSSDDADEITIENISEELETEIGGLFFQFDYIPYPAICLNSDLEGGRLTLDNGDTINEYKPGKTVTVTITPEDCRELDSLWVVSATNADVVIATYVPDDDYDGTFQFTMPADSVYIDAQWGGIVHTIAAPGWNIGATDYPGLITTNPAGQGECGTTITINYSYPTCPDFDKSYMLTNLVVAPSSVNLSVNKETSEITFTMPDANITRIFGTYVEIETGDVDDICQFEGIDAPNAHPGCSTGTTGNNAHTHMYHFLAPGEDETDEDAWIEMDAAALATYTFDIAGTWQYYTDFIHNKYGTFKACPKSFEVYPAPQSIAMEGNQYNCDGDSIVLNVVATPSTVTLSGTFDWYKDATIAEINAGTATPVQTTDVPKLVINPCTTDDAGIYNVVYTPVPDPTVQIDVPCTFMLDEGYPVNVATLPNKPVIRFYQNGNDTICYNSSVELEWNHGVLNPDEYEMQWFSVVEDEGTGELVWTEIDDATSSVYETEALKDSAMFALSIRYLGDYNLCHNESDVFTVHVKDSIGLAIEGPLETCQGFVPDEFPTVMGDYTDFQWTFDGEEIGETSASLDFGNTTANGNLLAVPGEFHVTVSALDPEGCEVLGEFDYVVKPAPDVTIVNSITEDTAHYNDNPIITLNVCEGSTLQLIAAGAETYRWDPTGETTDTINIQANESMTYSVSGLDAEGCWNTTSIAINIIARPAITWVHPAGDTTFSMITTAFQLEAVANPTEGMGIYAYIEAGDPLEIDHPIENGLFNPSLLGVGEYQLVYSHQNNAGCDSEEKINITIEKPYWTDEDKWDPYWYDNCLNAGRFEINNPAQMGSFMAYVYGLNGVTQDNFEGKTIWVNNNIDLLSKPYFYRPFCDTAQFLGTFDGTGHVISNMTILEDNLQMEVQGFIRNVGLKDANISSNGELCTIEVVDGARFHNSYITMPNLVNVEPNFEPEGEVRNVFYYGAMENDEIAAIYIDNADPDGPISITPIEPIELLDVNPVQGTDHEYIKILEEWVWLQNDFYYRTWVTDFLDPDDQYNYGYPFMTTAFVHHHYITTNECDFGTGELSGHFERTIKDVDYTYAMNNQEITYTFTPESSYAYADSILVECIGYNEVMDSVFTVYGENEFTFRMPIDSIYLNAYELFITPYCERDYWTDEGNYDDEWYQNCLDNGRVFEIRTPEELAALAYMCDFGGENFDQDTITIVIDRADEIIDMTGHYWRPIYNFAGCLDGTKSIVDNLFIDENYDDSMEPYMNAMFVNLMGSVINFGIQDAILPVDEDGEVATYAVNGPNANGTIQNSFATNDPAEHLQIAIAAGEGNVDIENTYTLDENGNMIDHEDNAIDFDMLRAWVAAIAETNPGIYWDWKLDDELINYSYPIHSVLFDGGWAITYIPSTGAQDNGYISGPAIGHEGETITVSTYPAWCYDMETLVVDMGDGNDPVPVINKQFVMPNNPVTVTATFVPKNWTLTVNHVFMGETLATDVIPGMHFEDALVIADLAAEFLGLNPDTYVLDPDNEDEEMPCGNYTLNINYLGEERGIELCDPEDGDPDFTITTDPEDVARYGETVTVTVEVEDGVSIMGLNVTGPNDEEVDVEQVAVGEYTFVMPNFDVTICPDFASEYWDDYMIADPSWYFNDPTATTYVIETDSMLGGLAALVTGREWLLEHYEEFEPDGGFPDGFVFDEDFLAGLDFNGINFVIESSQEEGVIDLIEHKWRPIGAQIEFLKQFQGHFDGNGHQIINMTTADLTEYNEDRNGACQGLFGTVGANAVINDVYIQGMAEGRYFVAGLAGVNYGIIMNCVADVAVRSEFQAGGIVCNNVAGGYVVNSYCISDHVECTSAAPSRDQDNPTNNYYVGGVASYNEGTIINCHSVATLVKGNGTNPTNYYGGVVGMNKGDIANCYWDEDEIEAGYGANEGEATFEDCAPIDDNTADLMSATAATLPAMFATIEGFNDTFFSWTDGEENYPVFDPESRMIMSNVENELNVVLYPNPTKGEVKIFSNNIQRVSVYNMFGQLILDNEVNANQAEINMTGVASGVYMVRIITAEGTASRNIIVE